MGKIINLYNRSEDRIMSSVVCDRIELQYSTESLATLASAVLYFSNNSTNNLYKTKLNKLLFYTQFLCQKEFGYPFFADVNFIKDFYGPVMERIDYIIKLFVELNFIKIETNEYGEIIIPEVKITYYSDKDRYILKKVLDAFDSFTAREISNFSHNESLWVNTEMKQVIPLERAYELNGI